VYRIAEKISNISQNFSIPDSSGLGFFYLDLEATTSYPSLSEYELFSLGASIVRGSFNLCCLKFTPAICRSFLDAWYASSGLQNHESKSKMWQSEITRIVAQNNT